MPERRPYSRGEYNRALIANALLAPFNIVLLAVILIVSILVGIVTMGIGAAVCWVIGAFGCVAAGCPRQDSNLRRTVWEWGRPCIHGPLQA